MVQQMPQFPFSDQLIQVVLQVPTVLGGMPRFLVVLAIQALITLYGISCHLIRPFEECLISYLLQDLMYWVSEHSVYCLPVGRPRLPCKISLWSVVVESVRSKISSLPKDDFCFTFSKQLVFLNPFILVNPVNELA